MIAPCSCAQAASVSTGLIVLRAFETRLVATTLTRPLPDRVERVELQLATTVDGDRTERRAGTLRELLPGHEVRVVLELGRDDEVAGAEVVESPGVGDEVQRLGRAAREDDLARGAALMKACTLSRAPSKRSVARSASR